MKDLLIKVSDSISVLDLPTGSISIGPGTVPTSTASVRETSMKELIHASRKASRLGIFDSAEKVE